MAFATPTLLRLDFWSARRMAILVGFIVAAMSTLGPQFYVGPVDDLGAEADQSAKVLASRIETLRAAQSQYLLFEQMGVLIYALNATGMAAEGSSAARHARQSLSAFAARPLDGRAADDRRAREGGPARLPQDGGPIRRAGRRGAQDVFARKLQGGRRFRERGHGQGERPDGGPPEGAACGGGAKGGYDGLASRRSFTC